MSQATPYRLATGLMIGLVLGLVLGGLWSGGPMHAVATDRTDTFAMATGPVDDEIEAVFFLDFLTGELRAYVIGRQRAKFSAFFNRNVLADLGVDPSKNPKLMLVTGMSDFRRGAARMQPSRSIAYVAEVTSGRVAAYSIPWNSSMHAAGQPITAQLVLLDIAMFRTPTGTEMTMPN